MFKHLITLVATLALSSAANAAMIAGFDFSQYLAPGFLSTDGVNPATTLNANYSDLDAVQQSGIGTGSEVFGTLFLDGTANSSVATFGGPFTPANDLTANATQSNAVAGVEMGSGGAFNLIQFGETPPSQDAVSQTGLQTLTAGGIAVFQADLSSLGLVGADWQINFAGQTAFGGDASVGVEVSTDGVLFTSLSTETITAAEALFTVALGVDGASAPWVRLTFDDLVGTTIDNFTFNATTSSVPEPGTLLLGLAGLVGLSVFGRRPR